VLFLNPRRNDFDITDDSVSSEQIKWEYDCLNKVNCVVFFFPSGDSVCPITLYELGRMSYRKNVLVAVEDGYSRAFDVREQLKYARPELKVLSTLDEIVNECYLKIVG